MFGFIENEGEPCVFKKVIGLGVILKPSGSTVVFLILYVDNILLIGNDISMLTSVKI